jgi:hypothetical protein
MYYVDYQGKIQKLPNICVVDTKQKNKILIREKYDIKR